MSACAEQAALNTFYSRSDQNLRLFLNVTVFVVRLNISAVTISQEGVLPKMV